MVRGRVICLPVDVALDSVDEASLVASAPTTQEPATWIETAQAIFPNSRPMTREERRDFDASAYPEAASPERKGDE
jgi:hypothetical protein